MGKNSFGNWDISFVGRSQLIWEIYSFNSPSFNLFLKYEIHRKINDWTRMLLRIFETTWTIQSGYAKEIDRVRESSMSDRDEYMYVLRLTLRPKWRFAYECVRVCSCVWSSLTVLGEWCSKQKVMSEYQLRRHSHISS